MTAGIAVVASLAAASTAQALPSGYAYEMVSPPEKNNGEIGAGFVAGSFRASASGDRFAYNSLGAFGDAGNNTVSGGYLATRGQESWSSSSLLLPIFPRANLAGFEARALSPDFSRVVTATNLDQETGEEIPGAFGNGYLYLYNPDTKQTERLTTPATDGSTYLPPTVNDIFGNADFSRIFFDAPAPLTEDAEQVELGPRDHLVYRYESGLLTLQSRLPGGDPVRGDLPAPSAASHATGAVSDDGNVMYFLDALTAGGLPTPGPLYRRDLSGTNSVTELVNASENAGEVIPVGQATFVGGSADGSLAYFTSDQRLVNQDADSTNDVYRYDHGAPAGSRLTLISVDTEPDDAHSGVERALVASADGSGVYFTSNSQLIEGESTDAGEKLYAWIDGELRFIAGLPVAGGLKATDVVLSENGRYLAFVSSAAGVTPEDNGGFRQVYLHDSQTEELSCVSCVGASEVNTTGAELRETGSRLRMFAPGDLPQRNVADDGEVFFETAEALLPSDTNGLFDVYGWHDGELELFSTGRSDDDSHFLDATPSGDNVFIQTRERLVGWDVDNRLDAYDVRLGGGYPEPLEPVLPCSGDACQAPPSLPPAFPPPGSASVDDPGNPEQGSARCAKPERLASNRERKAKRLERRVNRIERKAKRASGERAIRLERKARRVQRRFERTERKAKRVALRASLCRAGGMS